MTRRMKFKPESLRVHGYAYEPKDGFQVDVKNGCVRFGFKCMTEHCGGRGTSILHFNNVGRVRNFQNE